MAASRNTAKSHTHSERPFMRLGEKRGANLDSAETRAPASSQFTDSACRSRRTCERFQLVDSKASQKCLVKGCPAPGPVTNSQIRIYSMRFCPFAERTRLVLNAKGINYEVINIHLKNKPSWFLDKNPAGTVPVLETVQGQLICDSVITCEYLDEMFQDKKLFPTDPFKKAQQKMLLEEFSKVIALIYKIAIGKSKGEDTSADKEELKGKFIKLNEVLVGRKTKFFGGDSVTMIDYLMWPWFERVDSFGVARPLDAAPALKEWMKRMVEDPTVKATMFDSEIHKAFLKNYFDGNPNYDLGL